MADLSITAASVGLGGSSAVADKVTTGEAVTQGQPGYLNATDGKHYKADADDTAATAAAVGVFMTPAGVDGSSVLVTRGPVKIGATLTAGEIYVVSATAGGIAPIGDLTTGDYVTILGVAITTDTLELNINVTGVQAA